MKLSYNTNSRILSVALLAGVWSVACSSNNTDTGVGGSAATGGSSSTAGTSSVGGKTGVGGTTAAATTAKATGGTTTAATTAAATGGTTTAATTAKATGGTTTAATTAAATGGTTTAATTAAATGGTTTTSTSATGGTTTTSTSATGGTTTTSTSATGGTTSTSSSATGGTTGTAGSTSNGGTTGTAGASATGGTTGAGGSSSFGSSVLYDFEGTTGTAADLQGWTASATTVTLAVSTTQFATGAQSLKVTIPALTTAGTAQVGVAVTPDAAANIGAGSVLTFHAWIPTGGTGVYIQAYSQTNNYHDDTLGNSSITIVPGGWTTWTYTVPQNIPGGIRDFGFRIGVSGTGGSLPAGDIFIDSISTTGGTPVSVGTSTSSEGWETAGSVDGWVLKPDATSQTDTTIAQSTVKALAGTGSLAVTFTALPAGTATTWGPGRQIELDSPTIYAGQTLTFNVWTSGAAAAPIQVQPYVQVNGWKESAGSSATLTDGGWTTITYTIPAFGVLGIQAIGIQFANSNAATAYTGVVYIDSVSW